MKARLWDLLDHWLCTYCWRWARLDPDHPEGLRESYRGARECYKTRRESRVLCEMNRHML